MKAKTKTRSKRGRADMREDSTHRRRRDEKCSDPGMQSAGDEKALLL